MQNNIKIKRIEKNITQEELARKCGITLRQMQNIENNKSIPRVDTAIKIRKVLNMKNVEELFKL